MYGNKLETTYANLEKIKEYHKGKEGGIKMKKTIISLMLSLVMVLTFTACGEKEKQIELSSDVKREVMEEQKKEIKLTKVKKLDFGDRNFIPICWKNDENIIVIDAETKGFVDIFEPYKSDINLYSINIKTSKFNKINSVKDSICGDIGKKEMSGKVLYTKNNKLYIYDVINNAQKQIYDLNDVLKEIKDTSLSKKVEENELLKRVHSGFVKGSNKYIYIINDLMGYEKHSQILRIIDLQTGEVKKSGILKYMSDTDITYLISCAYSKENNCFYLSSICYNSLYEYKFSMPNDKTIISNIYCSIDEISDDGKNLYLTVTDGGGQLANIQVYNVSNGNFTKIANDIENSSISKQNYYADANLSSNQDIISYGIANYKMSSAYSTLESVKESLFLGYFNGEKINNVKLIPIEYIENKSNQSRILFNKEGTKFICNVNYFEYKNNKIKMYKIKNYIYEIGR